GGGGGSGGGAEEDLPLDLRDRLRDADLARARLGAVEDLATAPGAGAFVQDCQPLGGAAVARVEDEAVRVDEGGGADELVVGPVGGAGAGAGGAQDALGGVVVALALLDGLEPLAAAGRLLVVDQEGHDAAVLREERLHVDDEVLDHRKPEQRLERDLPSRIPDEDLAGEGVDAVDAHGVGAAHAVGAGTAVGEAAVLMPLDRVEAVQHAIRLLELDLVLPVVRLPVGFRVVALDSEERLHLSRPAPSARSA